MPLEDEYRRALTCDPGDYIYKSTISSTENSWLMIYHFEAIKLDLEVRVYHLDHARASKVFEHIRHLSNLRSDFILSPEKVFNWRGELWLIFPLHIGRPLNEVLTRHYPHGIPNERVTARILLDILEALEVLHDANLCHRNLATYNLFLERDTGITKLKDFAHVKLFEAEEKGNQRSTMLWSYQKRYLMPPEMLGITTGEQIVDEKKADIFLFAVTAMNLAYGDVPRNPVLNVKGNIGVGKPVEWAPPSDKDYLQQPDHISDSFRAMLAPCLNKCTSERPSAQELKKDKFFKKAAGRKDVKELLCNLLKIPEHSRSLTDVPPSQLKDVKTASVKSAWDFSNVTRQSTRSAALEDSKDFTPSINLTLDGVDEKHAGLAETQYSQTKGPKQQLVIDSADNVGKFHLPNRSTGVSNDVDLGSSNHKVKNPRSRFKVEVVTPFEHAKAPPVIKDGGAALSLNDALMKPHIPVEQKSVLPVVRKSPTKGPKAVWETKRPGDWEIEDVCEWLISLGGDFKDYTEYFRTAGIDGDMICSLTEEELMELKVTKKVHRRRILTSINKLCP